jgi:hypothetical protein
MVVEELRSIFDAWKVQDLSQHGIQFKETYTSEFDPNDDYRVIYEALFEPMMLDKARIEFWLTDLGHVAVGIETYGRVVQRLEGKGIRRGFVGGHEPRTVPKDGLKMLFDAVTLGKCFIVVKSTLSLITSAKIYMTAADCDAIARSGYRCSNWISSISDDDAASPSSSSLRKVLNYRPW